MKEFPERFKPENKDMFSKYNYERNLAYLRKDIFEIVLRGNENDYFDLDNFASAHSVKKNEMERMSNVVMGELQKLGWNVKTSFGGTGLFVYSTDDPPPSCYVDEF